MQSLPAPTLAAPAAVSYTITAAHLHAHLYQVELRIPAPVVGQTLSLPVWIPGSYLVREFSRHLQNVQAWQHGLPVAVQARNKNTWQIDSEAGACLTVQYQVYAFDNSVRTAWLDGARGFFNPTSLCLRVHGQTGQTHTLHIPADPWPSDWQLATALQADPSASPDARGFGSYRADDYDALADAPVEMGAFWSGAFEAGGIPHRFVVAGATATFDGERLLADTQKIVEAQLHFWHPDGSRAPHDRYVFLLNAVGNGYGGLEHRYSTALICNRSDLPRLDSPQQPEGYNTLLGLISHEYFHTWNVKRMRPAEFARYDYGQENYTELLWFFEGFTSYYDDLLLYRAGLLSQEQYLKALAKTIEQVQATPGRLLQTVAQASFDAWVKYYRQDENTANATVSYYTKGALVALCLDLTLRHEGQGDPQRNLDALMRQLWQHSAAGPMDQQDVLDALERVGGRSFQPEIDTWVHSTQPLPLQPLLTQHGVELGGKEPSWAQRLGLLVTEQPGAGISIRRILRGGLAEAAGLAVHDEWLGIEVAGQGWRIRKLDELGLYLSAQAAEFAALVARDGRMLRIPVLLGQSTETAQSGEAQCLIREQDALNAWLGRVAQA
ncbi:Predicted metalloprotease, contains C-terminal PDZ domain [Lampropedia hyalina DSM 16112]|jgi:predicted metalloprotease with PDZ domain|uniref:Predicted metalloprotease, contains C-terminal PDZ domain n=1 Tax=Lampropedia hyalina DSM 16112 TaxID=1122156 RepID=A0A1M4X231_9BURK|nr:M61 family metallopeptidase [Lampropedia hyalina]SHE87535.1 Predicted metalloprotease, contains C-terminal PDZ domain [Lampropedia hyalina DSM 16112]